MLNFIVLFGVLLLAAAFMFERVEFKAFWPLSLTLTVILLLSLIIAGLPWEGVFICALLCAIAFALFLHPITRRNIFLLPLMRRLDDSVGSNFLWEEENWYDFNNESLTDSAAQEQEELSFLEYLAKGRADQRFLNPTERPTKPKRVNKLSKADTQACSRLFALWDKKDVTAAELWQFLGKEGFADLERTLSPYAFSQLLTQIAYRQPKLARMVFDLNNGLASLLDARGTAHQQRRYSRSTDNKSTVYHLVPQHRLAGFSAFIGEKDGKGKEKANANKGTGGTDTKEIEIEGIMVHPTGHIDAIPETADFCGLCLQAGDPTHRLGETEVADVCILVTGDFLRRQSDAKQPSSFFVPIKDVLPLSSQDVRYSIWGKERQFSAILTLAESLRLLRLGGSMVAAKTHLQPELSQPLSTLARLNFLMEKTDALAEFSDRHGRDDMPPFEACEEDILLLTKMKRDLAGVLPELLAADLSTSDSTAIRQPRDVLLPCAEDWPEESFALLRLLKRATREEEHHAAFDKAVCEKLSCWGQNLIRSFGLGMTLGWISVHKSIHRNRVGMRSLTHLNTVFATLLDTEFFLCIWRGHDKIAPATAYLRAYRSLAAGHALSMSSISSAKKTKHSDSVLCRELRNSYVALGSWSDSFKWNRFASVLFKWFLMPWGPVSCNRAEELAIAEEISSPTAQREQALSLSGELAKEDQQSVLAEEVCKLAWVVRDIYDAHLKERDATIGSEPEWYDSLLSRKAINKDEAKLLHEFYATFIKFTKSLL